MRIEMRMQPLVRLAGTTKTNRQKRTRRFREWYCKLEEDKVNCFERDISLLFKNILLENNAASMFDNSTVLCFFLNYV